MQLSQSFFPIFLPQNLDDNNSIVLSGDSDEASFRMPVLAVRASAVKIPQPTYYISSRCLDY